MYHAVTGIHIAEQDPCTPDARRTVLADYLKLVVIQGDKRLVGDEVLLHVSADNNMPRQPTSQVSSVFGRTIVGKPEDLVDRRKYGERP